MNKEQLQIEIEKAWYRLQKADSLSMHEYEQLQRLNRIRFALIENHGLIQKQIIEALFLTQGVLMKDIHDGRKTRQVNEAIGFVYQSFQYLGPGAFGELIGVNGKRVSNAYENALKQAA